MAKIGKLKYLSRLIILFLSILGIWSCASVKRPQGGPKDETPPTVLKMDPPNYTKRFNQNKITITFDEYFNINNEAQEFSITPEQEQRPQLKKNLKKLEITFQDSLEQNTTYVLNFGNAIADVNESNVVKNLIYAFSTGDKLDSLEISGKVYNIASAKPEKTATVFILPVERDSLLGKGRPSIYTSTDTSGNFTLKHLKEGKYLLYAIKESTAADKIYQQRTDEIGFYKDTITLTKNISNLEIGLFKEDPEQIRIQDFKLNPEGIIQVIFNTPLLQPELKILDNPELDKEKIVKYGLQKDSVSIWLPNHKFDSLFLAVNNFNKPIDTLKFTLDKDNKFNQTVNITDNVSQTTINPFVGLNLYFNQPISDIDLKKVKLKEDTITLTNFSIDPIAADPFSYKVKYDWKKKANYTIEIPENTINSIYNSKNKVYRKNFTLGSTDDYGTYNLIIKTPDSLSYYILEILDERKKVIKSALIKADTTIALQNYKTESYTTRIIYDDNKNGKWDTGNVKQRILPEIIWVNPLDFMVRANWTQNMTYQIPEHPNRKKIEQANEKPLAPEKTTETKAN